MKPLFAFRLLLVLAAFAASGILFTQLPDPMPTHWNLAGVPDTFAPKAFSAFLAPGIMLLMAALFPLLSRIDPKRENYPKFESSWERIQTALVAFFAYLHGAILANVLGLPVAMDVWVPAGLGVLFACIGNFLGKIRRNYMIGFKLPWTLENEEVWSRTHRLGGRLWVVGGIAMTISALAQWYPHIVVFVAIILPALITLVYSYRISKR